VRSTYKPLLAAIFGNRRLRLNVLLAGMMPTILPDMNFEESLETTKVHSVMGLIPPDSALIVTRPFRSPHHTISDAGLIGGGQIPKPGEVSLSHNGVLFLDELLEFKKNVLDVLRQPLGEERVTIARAATSLTYPARFMLVAAMNPCPCGCNLQKFLEVQKCDSQDDASLTCPPKIGPGDELE
jgi:predicted ATPase with chaperone activity